MSRTEYNDDLFFNITGVITIEWVDEVQTVDQKYYREVLVKLKEKVSKKRLDL